MKPLEFNEVAKLINHSRVTTINYSQPLRKDSEKWSLFEGVNRIPPFEYKFYVLYFHSNATKDSISLAQRYITDGSNTQVVFAPSLKTKKMDSDIYDIYQKKCKGIYELNQFVYLFINDQLTKYKEKLLTLTEDTKHFVDPHIETPSTIQTRFSQSSILSHLFDDLKTSKSEDLIIMAAEPGQGKTYSTKHLVSTICKSQKIPIFIDSSQWVSMQPEDLVSISKTITNSFKHFESPIDWIEGCENEFLDVTLKSDIFRIIFDGFDEYILWNNGKVDAIEAIKSLISLTSSTGSNILVTSRTSFLNDVLRDMDGEDKIKVYTLKPFDRNHAEKYFNLKICDEKKLSETQKKHAIKKALQIYDELKEVGGTTDDSSNFIGRGFLLYLIADLATYPDANIAINDQHISIAQWLIRALCQREVKRQELPIDENNQLDVFRELATELAYGHKINTDDFRYIISYFCDQLDKVQLEYLVNDSRGKRRGKLQDHPLLKYDGTWSFIHDQIFYNLLAEQVVEYINNNRDALKNFFSKLKDNNFNKAHKGEIITELATAITDQIISTGAAPNVVEEILSINSALLRYCPNFDLPTKTFYYESMLATKIAIYALNKALPSKAAGRRERTQQLLTYLPGNKFVGLHFTGNISSLDLRSLNFQNCIFEQVTWANCIFDEGSQFLNCQFIGGKLSNTSGFGAAACENSHLDEDAKTFISAEQILAGKRIYNEKSLKEDIDSLIRKFVIKEGFGFKTVIKDHLHAGSIRKSKFATEVVDTFVRYVLSEHQVSGVKDPGYHISENAKTAVQYYINNGVFSGLLAELYRELIKKLKI